MEEEQPTVIYCDNNLAVAMAKNLVFYGKTKHMKIKFHFLTEAEQEGEVMLTYCSSLEQKADILTKAVTKQRFKMLRQELGVSSKYAKEE